MTGMSTQLHLIADSTGIFNGSSANISGEGFADMRFKVYSQNETDFEAWARTAAHAPDMLTDARYKELSAQSIDSTEKTFMLSSPGLYHDVIMKYMHAMPEATTKDTTKVHEGMNM